MLKTFNQSGESESSFNIKKLIAVTEVSLLVTELFTSSQLTLPVIPHKTFTSHFCCFCMLLFSFHLVTKNPVAESFSDNKVVKMAETTSPTKANDASTNWEEILMLCGFDSYSDTNYNNGQDSKSDALGDGWLNSFDSILSNDGLPDFSSVPFTSQDASETTSMNQIDNLSKNLFLNKNDTALPTEETLIVDSENFDRHITKSAKRNRDDDNSYQDSSKRLKMDFLLESSSGFVDTQIPICISSPSLIMQNEVTSEYKQVHHELVTTNTNYYPMHHITNSAHGLIKMELSTISNEDISQMMPIFFIPADDHRQVEQQQQLLLLSAPSSVSSFAGQKRKLQMEDGDDGVQHSIRSQQRKVYSNKRLRLNQQQSNGSITSPPTNVAVDTDCAVEMIPAAAAPIRNTSKRPMTRQSFSHSPNRQPSDAATGSVTADQCQKNSARRYCRKSSNDDDDTSSIKRLFFGAFEQQLTYSKAELARVTKIPTVRINQLVAKYCDKVSHASSQSKVFLKPEFCFGNGQQNLLFPPPIPISAIIFV